jgi:RHS repeat-associated protein
VRLDYPDVIGQKIVKYRVRALHETGTPLLFRGIKIYRQGRMMLELEKAVPTPRQKPSVPPFEPPSHYPADAVLVASLNRPGLSLGPAPPPIGFRRTTLPPMHPAMVQTTTTTASSDPNHFKWNGKEFDAESGLYNFGARYYSPGMGRFTSPDPKMVTKQKMFDPQQWNMYSFARNNPTTFTDPNGQEVRLAEGLSRRDQSRIIHNLAAAYRKESGRTAINGLAKSDITYRYGTGHLPDTKTALPGGGQLLEQRFGDTVPITRGTMNSDGTVTSVVRTETTVEVTFDFGKLDAASSAFLNGQRQEPPPTEQRVNDHELGHQVDIDKDPVAEHNQSTQQAEKKADGFANSLEKEKNTMSQKDAEKEVKNLLHDPK